VALISAIYQVSYMLTNYCCYYYCYFCFTDEDTMAHKGLMTLSEAMYCQLPSGDLNSELSVSKLSFFNPKSLLIYNILGRDYIVYTPLCLMTATHCKDSCVVVNFISVVCASLHLIISLWGKSLH
jgi:hypothetical protein